MNELKQFKDQGFLVIQNLIKDALVDKTRKTFIDTIGEFAKNLNVDFASYTFCTGRWLVGDKIPKTNLYEQIYDLLQRKLELIFNQKLEIKKSNIICKNKHITGEVPLHQDVSYSHTAPYHFTTWLALDDIVEGAGELTLIKSSHHWKIEPAVDFWNPYFVDYRRGQHSYSLTNIPLKKGDVIMFDSRLWHGSNKNIKQLDRYVYAVRWIISDKSFSNIPKPIFSAFGMWNCFEKTQSLLFNNLKKDGSSLENFDFLDLISDWQCQIAGSKNIEFDRAKVISDLANLKILHQAANYHNAGDLCGKIYKNLWFSLLQHLHNSGSTLI